MTLFTRVSRLFRADVNAVLDRMEEPDVLLRQALREMEQQLVDDEQVSAQLGIELEHIAQRADEIESSLVQIEEELDLCFDTKNDELTRVLVKRKLEAQQFLSFTQRKQEELQHKANQFKQSIEENHQQLRSLQQKAEVFATAESSDESSPGWLNTDFPRQFKVTDHDIEIALLREKQKRVAS